MSSDLFAATGLILMLTAVALAALGTGTAVAAVPLGASLALAACAVHEELIHRSRRR